MKQCQHTKNRSSRQSFKKILFSSVVFMGLSAGSMQHSYAQGVGISTSDAQEHKEKKKHKTKPKPKRSIIKSSLQIATHP